MWPFKEKPAKPQVEYCYVYVPKEFREEFCERYDDMKIAAALSQSYHAQLHRFWSFTHEILPGLPEGARVMWRSQTEPAFEMSKASYEAYLEQAKKLKAQIKARALLPENGELCLIRYDATKIARGFFWLEKGENHGHFESVDVNFHQTISSDRVDMWWSADPGSGFTIPT